MRAIEALPQSTRTRIRSTQLLTGTVQIVSELVQNALDAHATAVDVGVDCDAWSCWVRDDGEGISREGLTRIGSDRDAARYITSKTYSPSVLGELTTFGFRGEALASIADIACLEISSRASKNEECWSVIVKGGARLHCGPSLRWKLPDSKTGTVVSVRDAFYNLPVRRSVHSNSARTLDLIRREIEIYALACPNVSFTLENTSMTATSTSKISGKVLVVPKTMSPLNTFRRLYGRALAENIDEINLGSDKLRMKGFISLNGAPSKAHQFLFVNRHPVRSPELSKCIDNTFAASTFAKHAYEESGKFTPERPHQKRSPRKQEKHPIYVLDITVPSEGLDNCLESSKSMMEFKDLHGLTEFVASVIKAFLERNGFRPAKTRKRGAEPGDGSPRKKARIDRSMEISHRSTPTQMNNTWTVARSQPLLADDEMKWTDPESGAVFVLDKRTGNSVLRGTDDSNDTVPAMRSSTIVDTRSLQKDRPTDAGTPAWIENVFQGWANPTFRPTVRGVLSSLSADHSCSVHASEQMHTFSREDLRAATVLSQVDRKFVACLLPPGVIVLLDQHAADERVRVERFLRQLCSVGDNSQSATLDEPIPVLVTQREAALLARNHRFVEAFAKWGVDIDAHVEDRPLWEESQGPGKEYAQVWVHSLPEVVADKLLQENELRDFVKSYLATLESDGTPPKFKDDVPWNVVLQHCPRSLVDLVNSKACRGAIMFNDTLDLARCKRLVSELSDTVFPFQCAHGRPSIAPLTGIDALECRRESSRRIDWDAFVLRTEKL